MTSKPKMLKMVGGFFLRAWARGKVTLVTVVVALSLALISPALAATGGNFILGVANTATDPSGTATGITQLTANIANPAMKLINTSTATGATALNLRTASSKPPMTVNSGVKVANLNSDRVDGKDSTALLPGGDLPSGRTVRGNFEIAGHGTSASGDLVGSDSISFGYRLAAVPTVQWVRYGQASTTECPGSESSPEAAKGYLCIYEEFKYNTPSSFGAEYPVHNNISRTGVGFQMWSAKDGSAGAFGTWAVTAP